MLCKIGVLGSNCTKTLLNIKCHIVLKQAVSLLCTECVHHQRKCRHLFFFDFPKLFIRPTFPNSYICARTVKIGITNLLVHISYISLLCVFLSTDGHQNDDNTREKNIEEIESTIELAK